MKTKDLFMYILAVIIIAGIFILLGVLLMHEIPTENKDLLNIVIGAFIASFSAVISYFFGSSKGSAEKNEMLKNNGK